MSDADKSHDAPPGERRSAPAHGDSLAADQRRDAFARLFAKYDRWLFSYLVTLLAQPGPRRRSVSGSVRRRLAAVRPVRAGDRLREVGERDRPQPGAQVSPRRRSGPGFQLSDETCERLAADAVRRADLFDFRRDALRKCLGKLPGSDRQLVQRCYGDHESHESFKAIAEEIGRPVNTVYKALNRIRRSLHECIDRTLAAEGLL